eukprot:gene45431-56590_t
MMGVRDWQQAWMKWVALDAAQGQPTERLERLEGDAGNAGRAKKQPLEAADGDEGQDVVDGVDGGVVPALVLPSVAFLSVSTDSERKEPPPPSSAPAELKEDAAGGDDDDATADATPTEDVSFVKAAHRRAFWRKPLVRVALVAVSLGLLAVLAGQVAVHERNRLAAMEPRLRPALLALCEPLECALAPQRQISDVVIDSSSFNKARGDSYVLAITMKSRATLPLEMPAVELTLTDAQDQPVLRRVLLPSEMSAPQELPAGGGEQAVFQPQRVLAGFPGWIGLAAVDDGTYAGIGGKDVRFLQVQLGKLAAQPCQQIADFAASDGRFKVHVFAVVHVSGADQRDTLPGEGEYRAAVGGVHQAHGLGQRQTPCGQDEVAAAQGTQAPPCPALHSGQHHPQSPSGLEADRPKRR